MSEAVSKVFAVPDYEADAPGNKPFPECIRFRAPRGTRAAVAKLAKIKRRTPTEVIRQLIEGGLAQEGLPL